VLLAMPGHAHHRTVTLKYANGHFPDAVNIPVDESRGRLAELPKDRLVVAFCQVGRAATSPPAS